MPCEALLKQGEKKTKNNVISNNAKDESNTLMRGNVNLAKKFGMVKMTMEIDG